MSSRRERARRVRDGSADHFFIGRDSRSPVSLLLVGIAVAVWVVVLVAIPPSLGRGVTLSAIAVASVAGCVVVLDREDWILSPAFWFCVSAGLVFVGRPFFDLSTRGSMYELGIPIGSTYSAALVLGSIGILCFGVGYTKFGIAPRLPALESDREPMIEAQVQRFDVFALVATIVSLSLGAFFVISSGGFGVFLNGRSAGATDAFEQSSGYLYSAPQWLFPIGLYYVVRSVRSPGVDRKLVGIALIAASQALSLLLGSRSFFLVGATAAILAIILAVGRRPKFLFAALTVPAVVYFGVVVPRVYRDTSLAGGDLSEALSESLDEVSSGGVFGFLDSPDFAMARNLAVALRVVPNQTGYGFGETYIGALARPIPSELFGGDKPTDVDTLLNEVAIYQFREIGAGFSYSFVSEPFYNFGVPGVVAFGLLFGLVMRVVRDSIATRIKLSSQLVVFFSIVVSMIGVFVRGNLGTDYQRLVFYLAPLWAVLWASGHMRDRRRAERELAIRASR